MDFAFRTYSVDSSESSSDEASDKDVREEVEELNKVLADLVRENRELEVRFHGILTKKKEIFIYFFLNYFFNCFYFYFFQEKRMQLCQKIQDERSACINLRVQIRFEQERILRRRDNKK